ncbi:EamA family transporter [Maribrevibacterium harenarium]|uniref:EamA family transporter n=1 Tax=Maribrevibacterium harenarium TaxID=2589817 RepID=A0A501WDT7_9GAMM|nr:EamA family transporter [Maribrevibacterium harenarium]TPE45057.1 EamA family transporter [Maribrevibacterium harenarium]
MRPPANLQNMFGTFAILLAALLWGTTGTAAHFAPAVSPLAIGAFAMGVGGILQALRCRHQIRREYRQLLRHRNALIIGTIGIILYPLAFYSSMALAGVAIGNVVSIGVAPFAAALLERFFGRTNPITRTWILSASLGALGIMLLAGAKGHADGVDHDQFERWLGIALGVVAASTYALYTWIGKRIMDDGVHGNAVVGSMFLMSSVVLLPTLVFTGGNLFDNSTHASVALYMAFVPMFIGYVAFAYGLRTVAASTATLLTLFEPVVAAVLAVTVVGESISQLGWIGMGLIGVCLLLQSTRAQQAHA